MKTVVLATNNAHKVAEIATALDFPGWEFRTLRELGIESDPAEDADTFEGNARIKARAAHEASGGLAALADDSGLVVDALDGALDVFLRGGGSSGDADVMSVGKPRGQKLGSFLDVMRVLAGVCANLSQAAGVARVLATHDDHAITAFGK